MNRVVHFEMPYSDRKRAAKFYEKLLGWKAESGPAGMTMLTGDKRPFAGVAPASGAMNNVEASVGFIVRAR